MALECTVDAAQKGLPHSAKSSGAEHPTVLFVKRCSAKYMKMLYQSLRKPYRITPNMKLLYLQIPTG